MSLRRQSSCAKSTSPASPIQKRIKDSNSNNQKRRKDRCLFFAFGMLAGILSIWLFLSFHGRAWNRGQKGMDVCRDQGGVLLRHRNVSRAQVHFLASSFSDSKQVASFSCTREHGHQMPSTDCVTCLLKNLWLNKRTMSLSLWHMPWIEDSMELFDQCMVLEDSYLWKTRSKSKTEASVDQRIENCEHWSFGFVKGCLCFLFGLLINSFNGKFWGARKEKPSPAQPSTEHRSLLLQQKLQHQAQSSPRGAGTWRMKLLVLLVLLGVVASIWLFWVLKEKIDSRRKETLANMCDERARMLQDQFNVSMNHVHALAILVSTFHHGKSPSAIDQKTFGEYTERTAFERPLTSGVAYALKVHHSEREQFEKHHGWTIKKMGTENLVQDCIPENLDPAPIQEEYAPVIFSQETVSHIVSIDMMSGKEDRENILRARATGKGVLTSPFKLLKSNHLGVVLTFAVYNKSLPPDASDDQRIQNAVGYLGASYDVPSLVEKLLHQLASKQTIVVNVYDTTNDSAPINMYGTNEGDAGLLHISGLDFGDPLRKHEMHCRFKQKPPLPWTAINASVGVLVIILLVGQSFYAAICRIAIVEEDYQKMERLKYQAEAADVAKSQFLATVSHEIRTPMNGVLGMLQMLMDTDLDATQMDYAKTACDSGTDLITLINDVLDQAKIESGRLELEHVPFDLRSELDHVLSLFSCKSDVKGIELAVYVSRQIPNVVVGDPGRFRQIITNLVGNSIKFTREEGHIFVSVHLADELKGPEDDVLQQCLLHDSDRTQNTLSGLFTVNRRKSWKNFRTFNGTGNFDPRKIELLVTIEDTGVGIPLEAQKRIFTPFMQADSSTSRTYGGTGIGLSISKCLVELMQGEIGFVSEPGIGSTFSFTGVFAKMEVASKGVQGRQEDKDVLEFQGLRALVIDNRSIRASVTRYHLQRLGILVDVMPSLALACSHITTSLAAELAMVVVDKEVWSKEEMLVFHDFLAQRKQISLRESPSKAPKTFLSATSPSPEERCDLKACGLVDEILKKPLRLHTFLSCFREAFGNGKKSQVRRKKRSNLGTLLKEKQILVVDDNMVNRKVAEGALKKYGAVVTCVDSGKAALSKLKPPHTFDACFMDLQMPEMDGFQATEKIRQFERESNDQIGCCKSSTDVFGDGREWHIPILAMTADVIQATDEKCKKCGMDGYVTKPFEEDQLYTAVARFFESG